MLERTPAINHLIALVRAVTARINQRRGRDMTEEDMVPIMQFVASLSPEDVGLSANAHAYITPPPALPTDIRYLHIAQENDVYSIGVFVLPPGACIPLHDHPNMSVVSHALYGTVKITCYDRVHESRGGASGGASAGASLRQFATQTFGGGSGRSSGRQSDQAVLHRSAWHEAPHTSCLTPHKANIHRLEAGHQGVGILDVLIPPYDEARDRDCTYYQVNEIQETGAPGRGGRDYPSSTTRVRLTPCIPNDLCSVIGGEFVPPCPSRAFGHGMA